MLIFDFEKYTVKFISLAHQDHNLLLFDAIAQKRDYPLVDLRR